MKIRVGVITVSKESFLKISESFPNSHFHYATNVLQFYQLIGSQKPDLMIFHAVDGGSEADLLASLKFLRSKNGYQKMPFLILNVEKNFRVRIPILDPYLRAFQIGDGLFVRVMDFMGNLKRPEALEQQFKLAANTIENSFMISLGARLGLKSDFKVRTATDDEMHSSFFSSQNGEISTSLFWVKFTARILEQGNSAFVDMFKDFSDNERDEMAEKILGQILKDFKNDIEQPLLEAGAVSFPASDDLEFEYRKPFVKTAVNRALIFESEVCRFVLESTQYI